MSTTEWVAGYLVMLPHARLIDALQSAPVPLLRAIRCRYADGDGWTTAATALPIEARQIIHARLFPDDDEMAPG